ncbi:MAG: phosphate signaling complex protein PhoU [Phycisphaera sp.]|nr:phosphate signaling complex protein PhoU [Phycisphaera sp.]
MSQHLQRQIDRLKKMILSLGALVEETLDGAIKSVESRDPALAHKVVEGDTRIDAMEIEVEEECLHTLALHQPVAFDLRFVIAVLKINNDLERIGDLAVNIAQRVDSIVLIPREMALRFNLLHNAQKVRTMLQQCLDALVNIDPELAQKVRETDDEVDADHRQSYRVLADAIREDPERVENTIQFLSISRNLERIADHTVNIAEDVIYMAKGDITRHSRPHPLKK